MRNIFKLLLVFVTLGLVSSCSKDDMDGDKFMIEGDWAVYKVVEKYYDSDRVQQSRDLELSQYSNWLVITGGVVTDYPYMNNTVSDVKFYFLGDKVYGNTYDMTEENGNDSYVGEKVSDTEFVVEIDNDKTGIYWYAYIQKQ